MYRRILVATDLGESSEAALRVALDLARRVGAVCEVLHVVEPAYQARPWLMPFTKKEMEFLEEIGGREQETARRALEDQVKSILSLEREQVPFEVVVRTGLPADVISATAKERQCDLLVTGSHGRRGVKHVLLGSIAERVVRTAPCPVLTVRSMTAWRRILCPVDFSDTSHRALQTAADLAARLGSELTLLNVLQMPDFVLPEGVVVFGPDMIAEAVAFADKTLAEWKAEAEKLGCTRVTTSAVMGNAGADIHRIAGDKGIDLVVMGTQGRGGFSHLLLGSVAEKVVRRAPCPVLTVRA